MSYPVRKIQQATAENLAFNGLEAYVNPIANEYYTYQDVSLPPGSIYTDGAISSSVNSSTLQLTYDAATGGYPPRKKNMFPR